MILNARIAGLLVAMLTASAIQGTSAASGTDIVTLSVENHGKSSDGVPATFGEVFAPGDVPRGSTVTASMSDGTAVPLQLDAKATNADGSLRHGVITILVPHLAPGGRADIVLHAQTGTANSTPAIIPADLPPDFDAIVTLKTHDGVLTASAKSLLAAGHIEKWLSGPLVSEWWVAGPFHDASGKPDEHMYVQFGIRCYGKGRPVRVEADVENDWAYIAKPKTEFYDAQIQANGRTIYSGAGLSQPSYTRWRYGFWWDEPVATYVRQDLDYLKRARVIPNYDPSVSVSPAALSQLFEKFDASPHGPMTAGIIEPYMPETGGRWDIAPLPHWQALYLLTMDAHAYAIMLMTADQGASFRSHYRNLKTRAPITLDDYPKFSTHSNLVGQPGQLPLPDTGGYKDPLTPDAAHEPALDFLPYLVTGDRFYLEELQFWAEWNLSGTDPAYRDFAQGLVKWDQVRAQAWSLRTLAQAAYITPDSDPLKKVFRKQLKANIAWYEDRFVKGSSNALHFNDTASQPYDNGRAMAPWQDDFFTWSIGYIQGLGDVDAMPLLRWKAVFPVARMTAPGFCWILAASYTLNVRPSPQGGFFPSFADVYSATLPGAVKHPQPADVTSKCGGPGMADELGLPGPGVMIGEPSANDGYTAILQTALATAVDAGVPQSDQAWQLFMTRTVKPDYSTGPEWAIVPRKMNGQGP